MHKIGKHVSEEIIKTRLYMCM